MSETTPPRPIQREHLRQRHAKDWVRDYVAAPHEFFAFDRSKAASRFAHLAQRSRGVRRATPDTKLKALGCPAIWTEWKAPGQSPTEEQHAMGQKLQAVGDLWTWQTTVLGYCRFLAAQGVPLRPGAEEAARYHDEACDATIARAEAKREVPRKKRAVKAQPRYLWRRGRMLV